ncbi:hypothetical protein CY35_05G129800 [Sphagnum magellanicum]|jgi:hypothetical protein|nr:hypothetical protein CY35_05G129800 [Sphagnum magellanicum]
MCPLRVILLFLSALLAGYFALKSVRYEGNGILDMAEDRRAQASVNVSENGDVFRKAHGRGKSVFWLLVDMASGQYLWQNLRMLNKGVKAV